MCSSPPQVDAVVARGKGGGGGGGRNEPPNAYNGLFTVYP